jgi:peptide/nickel transport system permease protein
MARNSDLELKTGSQALGDLEAAADEREERIYVASNSQLMWWKFRKHKAALFSTAIVIVYYIVALLVEFIAPYDPQEKFVQYKLAPPSKIRIVDSEGNWRMPFVYGTTKERDIITLRNYYIEDTSRIYPIRFFVDSDQPYKLWGLIPMETKLIGLSVPRQEQGVFFAGTDNLGRDVFSRVVYGARLSLSVGLVGVFLSLTLGVILGGVSGYYGGAADNVIQRLIEFLRSIPNVPMWMALSAALPPGWPIIRVYFGITVILSLLGWTGMARVVRGRFLALREEDFVMAARLAGANEMRIILRHMLPSFTSHLIASMTLSIPGMILGETGLSFLGLGLREPAISWGVLLSDAQNVASVVVAPWKLWGPAVAVVVVVLAMNFMGDGLRDAADPYSR